MGHRVYGRLDITYVANTVTIIFPAHSKVKVRPRQGQSGLFCGIQKSTWNLCMACETASQDQIQYENATASFHSLSFIREKTGKL